MTFDEWWIDFRGFDDPYNKDGMRDCWEAAQKVECEACAKICDEEADWEPEIPKLAAAIRARHSFENPDKVELLWRKIARAGCPSCGCKVAGGHYAECPALMWSTKTTPAIYFVIE